MRKPKTHFEQIPVEIVEKIIADEETQIKREAANDKVADESTSKEN